MEITGTDDATTDFTGTEHAATTLVRLAGRSYCSSVSPCLSAAAVAVAVGESSAAAAVFVFVDTSCVSLSSSPVS